MVYILCALIAGLFIFVFMANSHAKDIRKESVDFISEYRKEFSRRSNFTAVEEYINPRKFAIAHGNNTIFLAVQNNKQPNSGVDYFILNPVDLVDVETEVVESDAYGKGRQITNIYLNIRTVLPSAPFIKLDFEDFLVHWSDNGSKDNDGLFQLINRASNGGHVEQVRAESQRWCAVLKNMISHKGSNTVDGLSGSNKSEDLKNLKSLLDNGVLTRIEYEEKKEKILNS